VAELILFHYVYGASPVHKLDPRVKVGAIMAAAISCSLVDGLGIAVLTAYVLALYVVARVSPLRIVSAMRPLLILVMVVVLARALTTPEPPAAGALLSPRGLVEGLRFGWRILLMAAVAALFLATTKLTSIKAAIAALLNWLPGVPAERIALMTGMTMGLLPQLLDAVEETRRARVARLIELRPDPLVRIQSLVLPVGRRLLARADETVLAMEARCYHEETKIPLSRLSLRDWFALAAGFFLPVIAVVV
jgi:energy-coupling factor transporter transmembrane protein EcfT